MDTQELEEFGFTSNEAKVYLALVRLGESTASSLTKITKLHRTNVYDALDRLIKNGFATQITINNTKHFNATDPDHLRKFHEAKKLKLDGVINHLKILEKYNGNTKNNLSMFEGIKGVKTAIYDLLNTKSGKIYTYGNPEDITERVKFFINQFHALRREKKIMHYHLYSKISMNRIDLLNAMDHTYAAIIPEEYNTPVTTSIYDNKIHFLVWSEIPMAIIIESEIMADTYRNFFKVLFEIAQKNPENKQFKLEQKPF
ncbi:hypothetical protein C0585_04070 [Candidatus Woesearchaeota archaeon]|nr:MAG: hypothetical protein C0585_04070 [Candidatus Woesearchaeota archaeon]